MKFAKPVAVRPMPKPKVGKLKPPAKPMQNPRRQKIAALRSSHQTAGK